MFYGNANYLSTFYVASAALIIVYVWAARRRKGLVKKFADKNLVNAIAPSVSARRRIVKAAILTIAASLCLFSLARPQWGFVWQEIKRSGLDIVIAIDVSKSMLARDVRPNRLERTKFAVKDLIKRLNGDRIGLVAFAGTAFLQCPLTIDYNGFLLTLDDLNVGSIPRGSTSITGAIKESIAAFKDKDQKYKAMIIMSDGEDLEGEAVKAASEVAKLGIKIYCVGVGTEAGDLIPQIDETGQGAYLADRQGSIVKTKLNENLLKQIAIMTGGSYIRATQAEFGLVLLYDKSISKMEKRDIESKMRKHYEERFQIFLSLAALLLFIEPLVSERKRLVER